MKMYSVYDVVTNQYCLPFFAVNEEDCKRKVYYSYQSNPFIASLSLYEVGDFDVERGFIAPVGDNASDVSFGVLCFRSKYITDLTDLFSEMHNAQKSEV